MQIIELSAAAAQPHDLAIATLAVAGAVCIAGAVSYLIGVVVVSISERRRRRSSERTRLGVAKPATEADIRDMVLQLREAANKLEARLEGGDDRTAVRP